MTSLDLHLNYPAKEVVATDCVEDVACGMYPCYYMEHEGRLKVSSSAAALIVDSGEFFLNDNFRPDFTRFNWYEELHTIDKRVQRLGAFEIRYPGLSENNFKPARTLKNPDEFIEHSLYYFKKFINSIEERFPEHDHVVHTGGKDSQLIHLVPKINDEKWHIFSSEPNAHLVEKWVKQNKVEFNEFFVHDNKNDEDLDFLITKLVNSDCIGNPEHIRWNKKLMSISDHFAGKCIFWTGTIGDTIYSIHKDYVRNDYRDYFKVHCGRAASWQGNCHQIYFNTTNSPCLSMYHSREIWESLYQRLDPSCVQEDLRDRLGEKLAGRKIVWLDENPGPAPWLIDQEIKRNLLNIYVDWIRSHISGHSRGKGNPVIPAQAS